MVRRHQIDAVHDEVVRLALLVDAGGVVVVVGARLYERGGHLVVVHLDGKEEGFAILVVADGEVGAGVVKSGIVGARVDAEVDALEVRFVGGKVHARDAVDMGVLVGVHHALLHCLVQLELDSKVGVLDVALSVDAGGVWVGDHLPEREERGLASKEEVDAVALMVISIVVAGADPPPASMVDELPPS